jgi:single-stranded-DNA-specific exonuclease
VHNRFVNDAPPVEKRWSIRPRRPEAEAHLRSELGVGSLLACTLVARGLEDPEVASKFLSPSLDDLGSPSLLPDYEAAADAILGALERKERIFVHGDYDVDGVTSTALFTRFLGKLGCDVVPHVPHRMKEGYGIHRDIVQVARESGAKLFLTCDCGSSAHAQVEAAKEAGMTVVVTDHHLVPETLPGATAVINPHRADSRYPFPNLCGAGVVFRLCEGIAEAKGIRRELFRRAYLDLVALGTVADVMPLLGENRILVRHGLKELRNTKKVGLKALLEVSKLDQDDPALELDTYDIGFKLGPRLNAAGRIDDAAASLELLLESDPVRARELAEELDALNEQRREEQARILGEAIARVEEEGYHRDLVVVVASEDWHSGVVGIVAGKLVDRYYRPAFVLRHDTERGSVGGSARSIAGFHLGDAIDRMRGRNLIRGGGGHAMAAGVSLDAASLEEFRREMNEFAAEFLTPEDLVPTIEIEAEVEMSEVLDRDIQELERMAPFGDSNPRPLYACRGLELAQLKPTRNPEHIGLFLRSGQGQQRKVMAFRMGGIFADYALGSRLDIVFAPKMETFNGTTSGKWELRDFRDA